MSEVALPSKFSTLISADDLARCLVDRDPADLVIFDCRHDLVNPDFGRDAFRVGHIPGARFLHLDHDLSGPMTGRNGRHPLPDPAVLAQKLGLHGVGNSEGASTPVVIYDDAGGAFASRLWWLLRWLGHDRAAVLDGGLQAWGRAGGALETDLPIVTPCVFEQRPGVRSVDADFVLMNLETQAALLVDARSPDRFRGENETLDPVAGHIPGAVNRFFRENLERTGLFKLPAVLRQEFKALMAGHSPSDIVHQCGSGVTACHNLLAMEHAGLSGSTIYPGSWSEWCADPARPVARGH